MGDRTKIEWTQATWNPTTGCDRVSPGCDHCYALTMAKRLKAMGSPRYQRDGDPSSSGPGFGLTVHDDALDQPLRWTKPRRIFVNSMSDLFHKDVPDKFIARVWAVMARACWHSFQVLTKRPARMRSLLSSERFKDQVAIELAILGGTDPIDLHWPRRNIWLGVSAENQQWADIRIPALLDTPAAVRFVSAEPLLSPIDLGKWLGPVDWPPCWEEHPINHECSRCIRPDWLIVGGESGPGARPMHPDWARSLRDQCTTAGVPFFMKQAGSVLAREWGLKGKGDNADEWPERFPQEYPAPLEVG